MESCYLGSHKLDEGLRWNMSDCGTILPCGDWSSGPLILANAPDVGPAKLNRVQETKPTLCDNIVISQLSPIISVDNYRRPQIKRVASQPSSVVSNYVPTAFVAEYEV